MGILSSIFGAATGGPIAPVASLAQSIIDRVLPDKAANDAAKAQLAQMALSGELAQIQGQIDTNKVEAASNSVWVAGWRPAFGWVGAAGLAYEMVLRPLLTFGFSHWHIVAPQIEVQDLITLCGTMLGFGIMRTVDKAQGAAPATAGH